MVIHLGRGRSTVLALLLTVLVLVVPGLVWAPSQAAGELSVATALTTQDGSSRTVIGYVVGQPTASTTVVTSAYPSDYALALADSAGETQTSKMLYVQLPTALRSAWGLASNPTLRGKKITVTGTLGAYFSHPGLKNATQAAWASTTPTPTDPPTPDPTPTTPPTTPPATSSPYDTTYYASALGTSGPALKAALHDIIDQHTMVNYDTVWTALRDTDQDPNNSANVLTLYSQRSLSKSDNGGGADQWNREHVWAKSHGNFGTATGPGTDLHHLRPEDVSVNATRSNKDFDNGGSAVSQCGGCLTDSDSFEPADAVKGDVARMIFYMAVRYEGDDAFPDLELANAVSNGTQPLHGKLSVLLAWNAQDPPSAFEKRRNDRIFTAWQKNRNPFIDHPEWANAIWK